MWKGLLVAYLWVIGCVSILNLLRFDVFTITSRCTMQTLFDFAIRAFFCFGTMCTFPLAGSHTRVLTKLHHRAGLMQVMNVYSFTTILLLAKIRLAHVSSMQ